MTYAEVRASVEDAFASGLSPRALLSGSFGQMISTLGLAQRHRTFHIGPVTPFKVPFYKDTLGLDILADRSHPECLETHERWPSWIPPLFEFERSQASALERHTEVLSEFTSQIRLHLEALKEIALATADLRGVVDKLSDLLSAHFRRNP
jgi:hypothetical protein